MNESDKYGDVESQKYARFIHKNYEIDNDDESCDDMLNDYIIKYKIKRDKEHKNKI